MSGPWRCWRGHPPWRQSPLAPVRRANVPSSNVRRDGTPGVTRRLDVSGQIIRCLLMMAPDRDDHDDHGQYQDRGHDRREDFLDAVRPLPDLLAGVSVDHDLVAPTRV